MKKGTLAAIAAAAAISAVMAFSAMAGEWIRGAGGWWFQNSDGSYPAGGIYTIENKNYAFDEYGYMVENAWYQSPDTGRWYYALGSGELATNQWIGNDYYVGSTGAMMTDTWTPDGYYVGSDGKWVEGATYVDPDIYAPEDIDISLAAAGVITTPIDYGYDDSSYGQNIDTSGYGDSAGITNWYTWDSNLDQNQNQGSSSTSSNPKSIPDDELVFVEVVNGIEYRD